MIKLEVKIAGGSLLVMNKAKMRAILRRAGSEVASVARSLIRRSAGGGKTYRRPGGGTYQASGPGQPPASRTGTLANSIKVRAFKSGEGVAIRDTAFYAVFLEGGAHGGGRKGGGWRVAGQKITASRMRGAEGANTARVLEPRPFLSTALQSREASIGDRIRAAVTQGIEFRRQKA